ncbi:uncharacterized protein LOC120187117 [Hibiscus syriacus]|uniref:uncharacterized protein LOC120187117 n=1 Tax=Hibiscus syriacus TaxID=106335 RepID=UPI0019246015|nr:uncharacterized protein LOC120187117 [Hibiscus syriacus]
MNRALLGKWVWKFTSEKKSWWKRVVCVVYNMDSNSIFMGNSWSARASWIWKCVVKNFFNSDDFGDCLRMNMRLKAGNGEDVEFWNDVWLGDVPLKILFPRLYVLSNNRAGKVMEFMLITMLNNTSLFPAEDDRWIWLGNGEGTFTTKSCINSFFDQGRFEQNHVNWENNIWTGLAPPRVEMFVWQLVQQRESVKEELAKRSVAEIVDHLCVLCGREVESVSHLFLHCRVVWGLWSSFLKMWNVSLVIPKCIMDFIILWDDFMTNSLNWKFIPMAVMWSVWKYRNEIIFQKRKLDLVRLSFIVRFRVASWFSARFKDVAIPLYSLVGDLKLADSAGRSGKGCYQSA